MKESHDAREAARWAERARAAGLSIGLVPTMGALHQGHFSLIERARRECDRVAATIFVNPTQFSPGEDLDRYPRSPQEDAESCRERQVDFLLHGQSGGDGGVYERDFQTWVNVAEISEPLCGRSRPGHFRGVATVVAILFGLFKPHRAYFGQKDFQQARLVQKLAADLRSGVEVRILPTVRDADGLAMSSRNRFLDGPSRELALAIPRALEEAEAAFRGGEERASVLEQKVRSRLEAARGLEVEYVSALDASSLREPADDRVSSTPDGLVVAVAVRAGKVRLIDNIWLRRSSG
jgi:pantoate--beta-alanine ligase